MSKKSKRAMYALLLAGAGIFPCWEALAEVRSSRVAEATASRQRDDFARLFHSATGLNEALKRVSKQNKVDNDLVVRASELKMDAAKAALAEGRLAEARVLLDDAYLGSKLAIIELMQQHPGASAPMPRGELLGPDERNGYSERMESTKTLRDALARVADEKRDETARAEVGVIDRLMRQADGLVAEQHVRRGRAVLDHAYLRAKVQLERLRGGETLVRALQFDTPHDEYRYELDRNDSYRMLVPLLVPPGGPNESGMKAHLLRASQLRENADSMAGRGNVEAAIQIIEESSGEYQEAIRAAGVQLPG